ncbi:hypothetical protein VNI00_013974 [Paramarasmius palmivorus]|uniref:Uncharacterized protein n=1 Tax=Paramarasmius palmivorus TaxID=297713 RepID=A0AAW0BXE8_9AGAR
MPDDDLDGDAKTASFLDAYHSILTPHHSLPVHHVGQHSMSAIRFIPPWRRPRLFLIYLTIFTLFVVSSYEIYVRSRHTAQSLKWMKWNYEVIHDSQSHPDAKILLVSAFFPSSTNGSLPDRLRYLLELSTPIYLFVPPSLAPVLRSVAGNVKINTTFVDVSSIPALHLKHTRDARTWFLIEGVKNLGGAGEWDYAFWIDFDAFREPFAGSTWPAPERLNRIWEEVGGSEKEESKIFVPAHGMFKRSNRYWKDSDGPVQDQVTDGIFFGGTPSAITWLRGTSDAYREHYSSTLLATNDNLMNTLILLYPSRFIGVHTDDPESPAWISPPSVFDDRWLRYMVNKYIVKDLTAPRALGRCGEESLYYQFFLANKPTRDKLAKRWLDAHDGWEDQIHVPGRASAWEPEEDERCRLTNPILFKDVLKRKDVFGPDWYPPNAEVSF